MLLELAVENYAVIDRLRVRFHPGLNLLTGETGSGKSIVVDALGLLLGSRASPEMVRSIPTGTVIVSPAASVRPPPYHDTSRVPLCTKSTSGACEMIFM